MRNYIEDFMGNAYASKGSNSNMEILNFLLIGSYSKRKEFAPSENKFFPIKVALIFERILILEK